MISSGIHKIKQFKNCIIIGIIKIHIICFQLIENIILKEVNPVKNLFNKYGVNEVSSSGTKVRYTPCSAEHDKIHD